MKLMELKSGNIDVPKSTTVLTYHGKVVKGAFVCSYTNIESLDGSPKKVWGAFDCSHTRIKTLEGCPQDVGNHFFCTETPYLISLHNIHRYVHRIGLSLYLGLDIQSHILGVLKIKDLRGIMLGITPPINKRLMAAARIINKHIQGNRDIHACQEELIEAGLGEYGQL